MCLLDSVALVVCILSVDLNGSSTMLLHMELLICAHGREALLNTSVVIF